MAKYVPRERKHRRLAKQAGKQTVSQENANTELLLPVSKSEKDERRRALQEELAAQRGNDPISGRKRKRLDKYIDTKLKKEENLKLLKKLAAQKVDTSLLQSSKKLGRGSESKRERFQRALQERNAGVDVTGDQDSVLFERRRTTTDVSEEEHEDEEAPEVGSVTVQLREASGMDKPQSLNTFGSGLKRPLEVDENGQPIIKRRKRHKKTETQVPSLATIEDDRESADGAIPPSHTSDSSENTEDEWNGFDSDQNASRSSESIDDEETSATTSDSEASSDEAPTRVSAFKAWANLQRNETIGFTPSVVPTQDETIRAKFQPRAPSPDLDTAPGLDLVARSSEATYRPSHAITVTRTEDHQLARLKLPVVQEEQKIMEAINNHPVVVVCGATGSGKTTQLPQMLLENGYVTEGMIGITQPRRVAATSVAARVASELGEEWGRKVAHQVRYDSNIGPDTVIKFMTDGILLREINEDFALRKYSAIVIDEAHERSVNTDVLIGMLSRIVPLRQELSQEQPGKYVPLKLIIMSASLRVADFILNDRLFRQSKPPIVEAEGRQYPVTTHFARKTQRDFVAETIAKVSRGHKKLPPGGMLVFLTGQDEIQIAARKLKEAFSQTSLGTLSTRSKAGNFDDAKRRDYIEDGDHEESDSDAEIKIYDGDSDDEDDEFLVEDDPAHKVRKGSLKPHVLPLYAALPSHQQMRVFDPVPEDSRLIVLSTNVAETSLTIPGIRYVFDCGRSKEKRYDEQTGVQEFAIDWISKANALQRTGRAGRTGPGHCYRLYSSAIYEQYFEDHTTPEILRTPIEGTVLQLKNMNVENVVNFPFPTPPKHGQLVQAEKLLKNLGAIDPLRGQVSTLGKELLNYPVNPRFGRMLWLGQRKNVLELTIALVAGLAVGDLFIAEPQLIVRTTDSKDIQSDEDLSDSETSLRQRTDFEASTAAQNRRQAYGRAHAKLGGNDDQSDIIKLLTAVALHAEAEAEKTTESFCAQYFLREKGMSEVQQLRRQLHHITQGPNTARFQPTLQRATRTEISLLKQIVAAGFIDQVAIRADLLPSSSSSAPRKPRRAIDVPYRTLTPSINPEAIDRTASPADPHHVFVHASSLLARLAATEMPSYVVYSHLSRAPAATVGGEHRRRTRLHPLTTVTPKLLAALAEGTPLLEIAKPIGKIEELAPGKRECWVGVGLRDPAAVGMTAWPLGAWKVVQTRRRGEWVVEKVLAR